MPGLKPFCELKLTLEMETVGKTPAGLRIDFPFHGTATSDHWEGERSVKGTDYVTFRSDGNMNLDLHGRIGGGESVVAYRGIGLSVVPERNVAHPRELLVFETADEDLSFLNTSIGVALGRGEGMDLELTIYLIDT